MNCFIAYFDYLGFKEFIENNDLDYQKRIVFNNFRDIEQALGKGKFKDTYHGVIADISDSKINCINFSDTVIFWTKDDSEESLTELLSVSHTFNWQAIVYFFPVRGSIVYGELFHVDFKQPNGGGGLYNINSVIGKGIVSAHLKANSQNWAGTVLDKSLIDELLRRGLNPDEYLSPYAKKYKVPYKNGIDLPEEFVYCIIKGILNDDAYKNRKEGIERNFSDHNKSLDDPSALDKLKNTIKYLNSFRSNSVL